MHRTLGIGACLAAAMVLPVSVARAQLLAYEGFNYTAGLTIGGQSGGGSFGWSGGWATGSGPYLGTNALNSLSYQDTFGNYLATSGGSMVSGSLFTSTASTPNRTLANNLSYGTGTTPGAGGTIWISFLAQRIGQPNGSGTPPLWDRQANVALFQGTGERLDIGRPNTNSFTGTPYDTWSLWHANGTVNNGTAFAQTTSFPLASPSGASFILMRIDTDATTGNDTSYLWVNWGNLTVAPTLASATLTNTGMVDLSGVNNIRIQANGFSGLLTNAVIQVDEFRVGQSFFDVSVVPEPSILALCGLGLLAALRLSRRKK